MASHCCNCTVGLHCPCGMCHTCGHRWTYYASASPRSHISARLPTTQKGKGLLALSKAWMGLNIAMPHQILPLDAGEGDILTDYPLFARPCPLTPRHGFVDSRLVRGWDELKEVLDETRAADPNGEVMVGHFINASLNAVWVPSLLTVGPEHDGATLGVNTISLPLAGKIEGSLQGVLPDAGIDLTSQDPYIEAVWDHSGQCYLTQLRAGPKLEGGGVDYIPRTVSVKRVIKVDPSMDLLKWEAIIAAVNAQQNDGGEDGTVVWHPGGSLTDHFSVHARTFSIPVCITFEPEVGQVIIASTTTPPLDPQGVLKGLVIGDMIPLHHSPTGTGQCDGASAISLVLHTLHNSAAIGGDQSWWIGVGVALMLRYGTLALRGEARHIKSHMPGRDTVYAHSINHTLQRNRISVPPLVHVLRYGAFTGSVGGIKWARCGQATARLFDAVGELAKNPTNESAQGLIRAFNFAVNQAHNGGWWLNKFISSDAFVSVQNGSLRHLMDIPPLMWRLKEVKEAITNADIAGRVGKWAKWSPLRLVPLCPTTATLTCAPGVGGLVIKLSDRLLSTRHKPIVVGLPALAQVFHQIVRGKLFVERTDVGMKVFIHPPHEEPIVLWEEDGIEEKKG